MKILYKAKYWDKLKDHRLNERQHKMINKLLDEFEGKLTSSKWAKICKCSQDTAGRDIQDLITKGVLKKKPLEVEVRVIFWLKLVEGNYYSTMS